MAKATAQDLVRVIRTARQFFLQIAGTTGCDCINGFGITFKKVKGKRTKQPAIVFYVNRKLSLRNLPVQNRIPKQINIPWEYSKDGVLEVVTDVQPGPHDGGNDPADRIATLTRFHPIDFTPGASNLIDAAIATPIDPAFVAPDIKDIGNNIPKETRNITVNDLGQFVQKSGRTTEHTTGYIDTVNTTVTVKYGMFEKATYVDQIVIEQVLAEEDISAGGDSGSAVLDRNKKLIGLLFAGSERDDGAGQPATAIINPIKHVFSLLNLETL